jgi:crotonobetainyl-CoA:carnitine CoA-transferase CaiB-like acyl-CoA transferase
MKRSVKELEQPKYPNRFLPLKGIKVLDLSRLLPGGFCSMILGDFGAEVIKVEEPGRGDYARWTPPFLDGQSAYFLSINRNKKSMVLDLKNPKGKDAFLRLARTADIVIESFRPGVVDRLGIGYPHVAKVNPHIIYCSISAFGQNGPLREQAGHDLNCLALSGLLSITGMKGGPPIISGVQLSDYATAMMAAAAILLAYIECQRSGQGQYCDISMLDAITSWMGMPVVKYLADGLLPGPQDSMFNGAFACCNVYETKDGRFVALGAMEEKFWNSFCKVIGREDLISLQWESQTVQEKIKKELSLLFGQKTMVEWLELLGGQEICFSPILNIEETLHFPHLQSRGMFQNIEGAGGKTIPQIGFPIKLSNTPAAYSIPPPKMGQDTRSALRKGGFSMEEIQLLEKKGIISSTASIIPTPPSPPLREKAKMRVKSRKRRKGPKYETIG